MIHLLTRCTPLIHLLTQSTPYCGKVNVDPELDTLSQLLIALSISFTLAQLSDAKKSVQLPIELHIVTLRKLFHFQFLSIEPIE